MAQNAAVQQQEELARQMQKYVELLKSNNATKEKLANAQKALDIANKAVERAKEMAKKKDSHKGFDSIAGYDNEKAILTEKFIAPVNLEKSGLPQVLPNAILFFGPLREWQNEFCKGICSKCKLQLRRSKGKY